MDIHNGGRYRRSREVEIGNSDIGGREGSILHNRVYTIDNLQTIALLEIEDVVQGYLINVYRHNEIFDLDPDSCVDVR